MIRHKCHACGAAIESPSWMIGQKDRCPSCHEPCEVPVYESQTQKVNGEAQTKQTSTEKRHRATDEIVECPNCGAKNKIAVHSDELRPVCGRCGMSLGLQQIERCGTVISLRAAIVVLLSMFLCAALLAVGYGMSMTPALMQKDFSGLIHRENKQTEEIRKHNEDQLAAIRNGLEKELAAIDASKLKRQAVEHYQTILAARRSYDKRYALTPREKAQLRMQRLASDSTKSYHDALIAVAREASPRGADIRVRESMRRIALHIDFDMSSITSGEHGTRTKHRTKESLKKEVISLISRVTNDVFQSCSKLNIQTIHVGCRHYVGMGDVPGSTRKENRILYKIRIRKDRIARFTSNPFLDIYSTTQYLEIEEDNFDGVWIKTETIRR